MQSFSTFLKNLENHLRYETSPIVAVIVVLKSKFFDFKTTIPERRNKAKTTIRMIRRYLSMFTLTIIHNTHYANSKAIINLKIHDVTNWIVINYNTHYIQCLKK